MAPCEEILIWPTNANKTENLSAWCICLVNPRHLLEKNKKINWVAELIWSIFARNHEKWAISYTKVNKISTETI